MSREEIEQVEKELDAVLEMVQRPVTVKKCRQQGGSSIFAGKFTGKLAGKITEKFTGKITGK